MIEFKVFPSIVKLESAECFVEKFSPGKGDLIFIENFIYYDFFRGQFEGATIVEYSKYGYGEPTDVIVEKIYNDIKDKDYIRVIGIGGGTIMDIAKIFALKTVSPIVDVFERKIEAVRTRDLLLVPTTCGTGSEMTNISILALTAKGTKFGLQTNALYADKAILIPELLKNLPLHVFAASSIDAIIHGIESYMSPKANEYTEMLSIKAFKTILGIYKDIYTTKNVFLWREKLDALITASNYAGIAFNNAGCGAVHAMSYPLGAKYHVAHGESNYAMFIGVFRKYMEKNPNGKIKTLNKMAAEVLGTDPNYVYIVLEEVFNFVMHKKALHEYGVTEDDLVEFTNSVMTEQGRLMANNYVELTREDVFDIYKKCF